MSRAARVEIPRVQWHRAAETVRDQTKREPAKQWLPLFTYDLQAGKVTSWRAVAAASLFFEYVAHENGTGHIREEYICLELGDGAVDADGSKLYHSFQYQNDPRREQILRSGIAVGPERYSLIGSSNSGVQAHSYVFRRGTQEENEMLMLQLMPGLRDLERKKGAPKRVKYQGLLFSGVQVVDLPAGSDAVGVREVPAVEYARFDFTDGCGLISLKLARHLQRQLARRDSNMRVQASVPSVWQIRYAGRVKRLDGKGEGHICKGVLVVDPRNDETYTMEFRKSMLKASVSETCSKVLGGKLGVIDWSRESPGRVSQQLLCLLTASVPDQALEDLQQAHLEAVKDAPTAPMSAAWLAGLEARPEAWNGFESMLLGFAREHWHGRLLSGEAPPPRENRTSDYGPGSAEPSSTGNVDIGVANVGGKSGGKNGGEKRYVNVTSTQESPAGSTIRLPGPYLKCTIGRGHRRHLSDSLTKVQIPLASCRTFFGAALPGTLDFVGEGECLVMLEDGPLEDKAVIVTRSPSYHPGDVRVLKNRAGELPSGHPVRQLRNCVFFSTQGARPEADKMGGGDLDGDKFLVIWDHRLLKYSDDMQRFPAADYDAPPDLSANRLVLADPEQRGKRSDWIHYAALTDNAMLGVVEGTYYAIAKQFGVTSTQAHRLNQLFAQLVDRNPAAIGEFDALSRLAYNPQHARREGPQGAAGAAAAPGAPSGNREAVWERMLLRQKRALAEVRRHTTPSADELQAFRDRLRDLCDAPQILDRELGRVEFHLSGCLQRRRAKRTLCKFRALLGEQHADIARPIRTPPSPPPESGAGPRSSTADPRFLSDLKQRAQEAEAAFDAPLGALQRKQREVVAKVEHQRRLREDAARRFDEEEDRLRRCIADRRQRGRQHRQELERQIRGVMADMEERNSKIESAFTWEEATEASQCVDLDRQIEEISRRVAGKAAEINEAHGFFMPTWLSPEKQRRSAELGDLQQMRAGLEARREQCRRRLGGLREERLQLQRSAGDECGSAVGRLNSEGRRRAAEAEASERDLLEEIEENKQRYSRHMCGQLHEELRCGWEEEEQNLLDRVERISQTRSSLARCEAQLEDLRGQAMELEADLPKHAEKLSSLSQLHADAEKLGSELGVRSSLHCGAFRGQAAGCLLSLDAVTQINRALRDLERVREAEEISIEIEPIRPVGVVELEMSAGNDRILEVLRSNYSAARDVQRMAREHRASLQPRVEAARRGVADIDRALKELASAPFGDDGVRTTRREERTLARARREEDALRRVLGKCCSLVDVSAACLEDPCSALKSCLTYADVDRLVKRAEQYQPSLGPLINSMKERLSSIHHGSTSDTGRYRDYHAYFQELVAVVVPKRLEEAQRSYQEADEQRRALRREGIPRALQERDTLSRDLAASEAEASALREGLEALGSELDSTFYPRDMEEAEAELRNGSTHEESLRLGIDHIRREFEQCCVEWGRVSRGDHGRCAGHAKKDIAQRLKRVCSIEEDRALGARRPGGARREPLPVYAKRAELNRLLLEASCVVITAGTGCGKSTQVPQYIVDDAHTWMEEVRRNRGFRLCCTQPRRLAAQSIAGRVAQEFETELGRRVGFQVGRRDGGAADDSKRISDETEVEFVTEGLLLARLTTSPDQIKNYDVVIVDEAHERNMETDLLLAHLRNHLARMRDDPQPEDAPLKVVVMSASIDWERFCEYFGGCPRMDCPGKVFAVEDHYRPIGGRGFGAPRDGNNAELEGGHCGAGAEDSVVEHATGVLFRDIVWGKRDIEGDVLIFLSGSKQILECVEAINGRARNECEPVVAYPLYAGLDQASKEAAKDKSHRTGPLDDKADYTQLPHSSRSVRKVVCCTNIAETSLTIDGVRFVLDGGKAKKPCYDHRLRALALRDELVARASTMQRRGRAGRTQTGWCYYLYSQDTHAKEMDEYDVPHILRMPVEQLILYSMHSCHRPVEGLGLLDPPAADTIAVAKGRLEDLGFVRYEDGDRETLRLTPDGEIAGVLSSMQPEAVRMLLWANVAAPVHFARVAKMAVLLSADEDIFCGRRHAGASQGPDGGAGGSNKKSRKGKAELKEGMLSGDANWERYACEQEHKTHGFGDHFLALGEFEKFENERARCPKSKKADSLLRAWCKARGLAFGVLSRAQAAVERCHTVLKKHKALLDQRHIEHNFHARDANDAASCSQSAAWAPEEVIARAMISGYFHQLVECLDPRLADKFAEFLVLSPESNGDSRLMVKLDRDSCIWQLVREAEPEVEYIADDDETGDGENPSAGAAAATEAGGGGSGAAPAAGELSFLLFSRLQCITVGRKGRGALGLVLMQGATTIDPHWIKEQAPARWIESVNFDPEKSTICRDAVKNVGPKILKELQKAVSGEDASHLLQRFAMTARRWAGRGVDMEDENFTFLEKVEWATGVASIRASRELCRVSLCGTQTQIGRAKDIISDKITTLIAELAQSPKDIVNVWDVGEFRAGLELQKPHSGRGADSGDTSAKFKGLLCAPPPVVGSAAGSAPAPSHRRPFRVEVCQSSPYGRRVRIFVNCGWSPDFFRNVLERVEREFKCEGAGSSQVTLAGRGHMFTLDVNMANPSASDPAIHSQDEPFMKGQASSKGSAGSKAQGKGKTGSAKGKKGISKGKKGHAKGKNGKGQGDARASDGTQSALDEDASTIQRNISNAVVCSTARTLGTEDFPAADFALLLALARESQRPSQFWAESFCGNGTLLIQFSPTYDCFEVLGDTADTLKKRVAWLARARKTFSVTSLARHATHSTDGDANGHDIHGADEHAAVEGGQRHEFTRSELCRFSAILEELRKDHPSALFVADFRVLSGDEDDAGHRNVCAGTAEPEGDGRQALVGNEEYSGRVRGRLISKTEDGAANLWLHSDYQRLMEAHANRSRDGPIAGLSISICSFSPRVLEKAASACRDGFATFFFPSTRPLRAQLPTARAEGRDYRVCVMCRRVAEICFGSGVGGGPGGSSRPVQGYRLTTCGCTYCRECFRAAAHDAAEAGKAVACRNCGREALARSDCQAILTPDFKDMKGDPSRQHLFSAHQQEWTSLARAQERRYCEEILVNAEKYEGPHKCPDCGAHSVFRPRSDRSTPSFFRCPTQSCPNEFCCRCRRVPVTSGDRSKCARGECDISAVA